MGIEEDFYATIKLKTGEEIFAKVAASEEEEKTVLIISNPITVSEVKSKSGSIDGYKFEPWLKTTKEDMFVINISDVLTMSESSDIEMIMMYENYIRNLNRLNSSNSKLNRRMGYISNIKDAKDLLEKLYKSS
jgi:hypothetical protein